MKNNENYCIYDTQDNDLIVGVFDSTEASKFLKLTKGSFYSAISRKVLVGNRYTVVAEGMNKNHKKG